MVAIHLINKRKMKFLLFLSDKLEFEIGEN